MKYLITLFIFLKLSCFGLSQNEIDLTKPFPFEWEEKEKRDWSFLKQILKGKEMVGLGESLHGVKEYSEIKLELIKYLHEELGFNVLLMETDLLSMGEADKHRSEYSDSLFLEKGFSPIWHTETNLKLVQYLQKNPNLKIAGFDYQGVVDFDEKRDCKPIYDKDSDYEKLVKYDCQLNALHRNSKFLHRDSVLAKNLKWQIDNFYKNEKIIIWAANDHLSKVRTNRHYFMGEILKEMVGEKLYVIGLFHSLGNPNHIYRDYFYINNLQKLSKNSLQAKLLKFKKDNLFIDIDNLKRIRNLSWVDEDISHIIQSGKYEYEVNISQSFDGILWFKEVTHPNYIIENKFLYKDRK